MCLYLCYPHTRYALLRYILLTFVEIMMASMRRLLTILLLGLCLVSCNRHSEHWTTITDMERIIEERPDSVLYVLQAIDTDELVGDEEPAKHALLLSMALDKNYIDKTDFEVLQPAIDYYEDNGTATDKLRTYFYQGRIYQNAGNDAAALECFVKAISEGDESDDILTKARIYFNRGSIHYSLYEWDSYIETNKTAASYFKQAGRHHSYVHCLIFIVNGYTLKNEHENALPYIDECKQLREIMSFPLLLGFYSSYITYLEDCGTDAELKDAVDEYLNTIPAENIDWLTLANAYIKLGQYEDALQAIEQYKNSTKASEERKYKALKSEIYEKLGRYEESLRAYKEYMVVSDSTTWAIMQQDTKFVEERHNLEMAKAQETDAKNKRTIAVLACVVALIGSLLVIMIIRRRLQISHAKNRELEVEKQKYEQLYADAIAERDALTKMVEDSSVKDETKAVIKVRLDVLNKVIISQITGTTSANKKAYEELELLLADKETFIESTRLTIEGNNPEFIIALKRRGLTDEEINICCLYAIGLKGKDIKAYTSQPRHYNQSADIRHKLGLTESDTNLSIFIRDMLEK